MTITTPSPAPQPRALPRFDGMVETWRADGQPGRDDKIPGVVLICEHASNALPRDWPELGGDLGLSAAARESHAASDIGALGLSRGLAARLAPGCDGAVLVHAPLSRLVYDLNRPADHPGAIPAQSEIHLVPGNQHLCDTDRLARVDAVYLPFHATVTGEIARLVARGRRPVVIAVHSFTPVYNGQRRAVEFGILFDDDDDIALDILRASEGCGLITRLNEPYSAQSDVAHTTRLHAGPLRLRHAMLEIRNDLIAEPAAQDAMAARLAPILAAALDRALHRLDIPPLT
jgi:predicted N-formylglutamate amidohydrolase